MQDTGARRPAGAVAGPDPADTGGLSEALLALLPSLADADGAAPATYPAFTGHVSEDLPEEGAGLHAVLDELRTALRHPNHLKAPGFMGWITNGATTAGVLAQTAAATGGGQRYLHHAFNDLEHTALRWLADVCRLPADAAGVFTSGGSTANLVCLGAARQAAFERAGFDVSEHGVPAAPRGRIYASALVHRTVDRAAAVLGLGRGCVVRIETDGDGRVVPSALAAAIDADIARGLLPVAAVAVAGSTDTGCVDPVADVVAIARERGCWVHVDGAYGLPAIASDALAPLFDGCADADSWIVDPHKWLATGVGVGAAYVHDGGVLTRAFAEGHADYLEGTFTDEVVSEFDGPGGPWVDQSVEASAPPRGVLVWAVLREIGRHGVAARAERHVALARRLAGAVREHPKLELLCEPDLSIVCYRHVPPAGADADDFNRRIALELRRTTRTAPSTTVVNGSVAIRPCFINPRQSEVDVDALVANTLAVGARLANW